MSAGRRGGIPGPENRTGLTRPTMTEAEFERRMSTVAAPIEQPLNPEPVEPILAQDLEPPQRTIQPKQARAARTKTAKPRRVQRMFAIEEEVDKKLWLYAIHLGKDRSEVVNDLLKPVVASMVLYDSRERRGGRSPEPNADRNDGDIDSAA